MIVQNCTGSPCRKAQRLGSTTPPLPHSIPSPSLATGEYLSSRIWEKAFIGRAPHALDVWPRSSRLPTAWPAELLLFPVSAHRIIMWSRGRRNNDLEVTITRISSPSFRDTTGCSPTGTLIRETRHWLNGKCLSID